MPNPRTAAEWAKKCPRCGETKPLTEFHKHRLRPDGHSAHCKRCYNIGKSRQRRTPAGRQKARVHHVARRDNGYYQSRHPQRNAYNAKVKRERPQQHAARLALRDAVRLGLIKKPPVCSECGGKGLLHGHHHKGYEHPLEVIWLCVVCHAILHGKERIPA